MKNNYKHEKCAIKSLSIPLQPLAIDNQPQLKNVSFAKKKRLTHITSDYVDSKSTHMKFVNE